jgi:CRP-like cAMP-binding protein
VLAAVALGRGRGLRRSIPLIKAQGWVEAANLRDPEIDLQTLVSLEERSCHNAFAEAVTDARVAVVRKSVLNEVIRRRPEFALKLFSSFSERLRQSDETIESLLDREVSARLATLLSHLGERFGEPYGSATIIKVRLTHQDLANMIFSTREAVSKEMSGFQRAGLIEVRNRRISVTQQLAKRRPSETLSNPGAAA